MQILSVRGGAPLRGSIPVSGAKNSVLPILAACAVCRGVSVLHNCPDISDVGDTLEMLRCLGCRAERRGGSLIVDAQTLCGWQLPAQYAGRLRSMFSNRQTSLRAPSVISPATRYTPCSTPQTTYVQSAPCQSPLAAKTIILFRYLRAFPRRLPPSGI